MHERTKYLLSKFGVESGEILALDVDPLRITFPLDGSIFMGGVGCGKTWRMAQEMGRLVDEVVSRRNNPEEALMPGGFVRWVNWPSESEEMKRLISRGFHEDAADRIDDLIECHVLFVDDLGQERIKSEDDWSLAAIREVLDTRYRREAKTFITTNLSAEKLAGVYGARIVSRMIATWPIVVFPTLNLRNTNANR